MFQTVETVSPDQFKSAFRNHPAGFALVTATENGQHIALTVSSLSSLSAEPPLLVFSVPDLSSNAPVILETESVVVHMPDTDSSWLARLGTLSGADRFGDTGKWSLLSTGEPYFMDASVVIRARVVNRVRAGASTLCIAEATEIVENSESGSVRPHAHPNRARQEPGDYPSASGVILPSDPHSWTSCSAITSPRSRPRTTEGTIDGIW
ncbi:flavin reductase [Microbacterium sp. LTA6]|uniref:flavin reductase family protein n=1 Tax=unclassified Microbacterium TaxID=2609290 RepID=UPI003139EBEF